MSLTPSIVENTIKFLERTPITGAEAYPWIEAHRGLQHIHALVQKAGAASSPPTTGVPFIAPPIVDTHAP